MGWGPGDLAQTSLWQYQAALDGWIAANSPDDAEGLTDSESDVLWDAVRQHETLH